jgi:hypothetical protein
MLLCLAQTPEWNLISGLRVFGKVQAKQWSESVANLQHALRGYSSDGCLWEVIFHKLISLIKYPASNISDL